MKIGYQNRHMFAAPTTFLQGELIPSARPGYRRLRLPSGRIFSMQPGGAFGDRDPDVDGPWEQIKTNGNVLAFTVEFDTADKVHHVEVYGIVFMAL